MPLYHLTNYYGTRTNASERDYDLVGEFIWTQYSKRPCCRNFEFGNNKKHKFYKLALVPSGDRPNIYENCMLSNITFHNGLRELSNVLNNLYNNQIHYVHIHVGIQMDSLNAPRKRKRYHK
eukprot:Pgem_evm1s2583